MIEGTIQFPVVLQKHNPNVECEMRMDLAPDRICEHCGEIYSPHHALQRWCSDDCRHEFRNAELRAARELWKREGKPTMEMIEQGESAA
jgi:hypothetical protein